MNNIFLSLFLLFITLTVNAMDVSHVLKKPFNQARYTSYLAVLSGTDNQTAKSTAVPSADDFDVEDEFFYANMVIVENMHGMVDSKQIPAPLSQLLQRFAFLSATDPSVYQPRFASMLNMVVSKAVELKIDSLPKLQSKLAAQKDETKKWTVVAQEWKMLHQDAVKEKEKVETKLEQTAKMLKQENSDLAAQLDSNKTALSNMGYELYERVSQQKGLQAENDYLRAQLAKAQKELAEAQEVARIKSKKNKELYKRLQGARK